MPIRSRLIALSVAILLPLIVAGGFGLAMLYQEREHEARNDLRELTRALAAVIGRELAAIANKARTHAPSPDLSASDLAGFPDSTLQRMLEDQRLRPGWSAAILDDPGLQGRASRAASGAGKVRRQTGDGWPAHPDQPRT
jgi:hypothetical protein